MNAINYLRTFKPYFHLIRPSFEKLRIFDNNLKSTAEHYEKKYKGKFIEKWILYWKYTYIDYTEVIINAIKESREKPLKTCGYLTGLATLWMVVKLNPDERSFRDALLATVNEIILVHPSVQRQTAINHVRLLEKCYNTDHIRYNSFGVFSVMWVDNFSNQCDIYESKCEYFQLGYLNFFKRIIDVGFLNKWWFLEKHVENYDVNESIC